MDSFLNFSINYSSSSEKVQSTQPSHLLERYKQTPLLCITSNQKLPESNICWGRINLPYTLCAQRVNNYINMQISFNARHRWVSFCCSYTHCWWSVHYIISYTYWLMCCKFRFKMYSLTDPSGLRTASVALRNSIYLIPLGFLAYDCE